MHLIIALCLLGGTSYVSGYGTFRSELPNGDRVSHPCKPNTFWRGVGHLTADGGGRRNQFGIDFNSNNKMWTRALCMMDSDGDGQTNGQELGDPDCVWVKDGGRPSRIDDITHPGVCTPFYSPHCQGKNDWVDCANEELVCPALSQPDVQNVTLRFSRTKVPAKETTYKCMEFDVPSEQDYHMVAYKPEIDNDNAMHHILLYGCDDTEETIPTEPYDCDMGAGYRCRTMLGGWALGSAGHCLNDNFGMPFGKTKFKRMALQYHWNNPQNETNWFDSSGLTIYYTHNLRPNNGGVLMLGQRYLAIPPGKPSTTFTATCLGECTSAALSGPIYVATAVNHMHYLGSAQSVEQRRNRRRLRYITNEPVYKYDDPQFYNYDPPLEILPNDELITTIYSETWTTFGLATSDEMCFAFLWFYPAEAMPVPHCTSWKSEDVCAECDAYNFKNAFEYDSLFPNITKNCNLSEGCKEDCRFAMQEAEKENPCLRGKMTGFVKNIIQNSTGGPQFLRRLEMCSVKKDDTFPVAGAESRYSFSVISFVAVVLGILL